MTEPRSLTVQSVLYENEPAAIVRAARSLANSVSLARADDVIGDWSFAIGDCSPTGVLAPAELAVITDVVGAAGGLLVHEFFDENLGHGGGHNRLATLTESDLILILNPDAVLGPESLSALARTVVDNVGLSDGRQLPLEHPKDYDPTTGDTAWSSGACMLIRREVFKKVGGFDHETFFMYCDDVDLSWRARLAGYRVVYQPAARVFHDKRLTVEGNIVAGPAEHYYSAEAAVLLALKYSRPDVAKKILNRFRRSKDEVSKRVVAEIDRRRRENRLPSPLDQQHRVARFVDGNYAPHRF